MECTSKYNKFNSEHAFEIVICKMSHIVEASMCEICHSHMLYWNFHHWWINHWSPETHFRNDFSIVIQIRWEFHSAPSCTELIAVKFCTWHDSCTVMACAKFCSDIIPYNGVTLKPMFYQIWITMEKIFCEMVPWPHTHIKDLGGISKTHMSS